ncbi:MAG: hypothetical protein HYR96_06435 [Deltaproteobacteria bacterium]|nr:hypothetical protein [Deltaproteobacteria bacterium]MBI3295862.1 hypothetical protein [Deltaproteobacteria bacterium]
MKTVIACVALVLAGCAGEGPRASCDGSRFETRQLSPEEVARLEAHQTEIEQSSETVGQLSNGLAGIVQKLISPEGIGVGTVVLAHATPPGVEPLALTKGAEKSQGFEKKLIGVFGNELIKVSYKISYQYGMKYKGMGQYLANVKFTPLSVSSDPLWKIAAEAVSEKPTNAGDVKNVVAQLGFSVTFTAKGLGTRVTTDEFRINAKSGEMESTIRDFE